MYWNPGKQIRKPRARLKQLGKAIYDDGCYKTPLIDSKGRVYIRFRRRGWREMWKLLDGWAGEFIKEPQ